MLTFVITILTKDFFRHCELHSYHNNFRDAWWFCLKWNSVGQRSNNFTTTTWTSFHRIHRRNLIMQQHLSSTRKKFIRQPNKYVTFVQWRLVHCALKTQKISAIDGTNKRAFIFKWQGGQRPTGSVTSRHCLHAVSDCNKNIKGSFKCAIGPNTKIKHGYLKFNITAIKSVK